MGKQLNYYMDYDSFLLVAQAALDSGCIIVREAVRKLQMDSMMEKIVKYPNGTDLIIFWPNRNLILQGKIDTIYESDNCLEEYNPDYKEFYACAFEIVKIIQKPFDFEKKEGDLIEISVDNQPSLISLLDGTVVWMDIPDFLQPTYLMLERTFPKGINEKYYRIILYLLYEHLADENLALVMAAFSGKSIAMVSNDLYGINHIKLDSKLLDEVKNKLDANGFEEWKEELAILKASGVIRNLQY